MYRVNVTALKKAMIDAGFNTNVELAAAANIDRNTLASVMSGKRKPSLNVIYSIADALNLSGTQAGSIFFDNIVA